MEPVLLATLSPFYQNILVDSRVNLLRVFPQYYCAEPVFPTTVELRFNEPLYNEVLGITNDIFQPSNSVMYGKEPRYNEPSI